MRTALSILLVMLVLTGTSYAANTNQGRLGKKNSREKMETTHLGKALLGLLELEASTAAGDGVDKLFNALKLLKDNLLEKKENEIADFNEDGETHDAEVSRINGLLTAYESQVVVVTQELADLAAEADSLNTDLSLQNQQVDLATKGKEQEEQTLVNLEANFKAQTEDYKDTIELLSQALEHLEKAKEQIEDELINPSLIQVSDKESWRYFADNLESTIRKTKKDAFVKPLVNFFAQLSTSQDGVDADSLGRAQQALNELSLFYQNGLDALGENYNEQVEEHQTLLTQLENQISTLNNIVIPRTAAEQEANAQNTEAKNNELADAEANITYQQSQLAAEDESWNKRVETHELLVPEYDSEFAIILQAENVLRNTYPGRS